MQRKKIILVDDDATILTSCKEVLKDLYDVYPAPSVEKMFDILKHVIPDLILLDVQMPGINGYEAIKMLKDNDAHEEIPVIFLSGMDDAESGMEGLALGAVDYINKPFVSVLLLRRLEMHLSLAEGKKKLRALNRTIQKLLASKTGDEEEETIKYLSLKNRFVAKMGHEVRYPLSTIIDMIETAIKSDDIDEIKRCLGKANAESRLILQIIDSALDI